jgi:hypothetical protein
MANCSNCGNPLESEDKFCGTCGAPVSSNTPPSESTTPPPPPPVPSKPSGGGFSFSNLTSNQIGLIVVGAIAAVAAIFFLTRSDDDGIASDITVDVSVTEATEPPRTDSGFSETARSLYLEGCESESPIPGFCECTIREFEQRWTEAEFLAIAMEENPPPEFFEIAASCLGDDVPDDTPQPTTGPVAGTDTSVFELNVGDCFDDEETGSIGSVPIVDCAQPHDNEIYFAFAMTEPAYPGREATSQIAGDGCLAEFEAFVGIAYPDSALEIYPIYPSEGSWSQGDRVVYCALYALDLSKLEGSMEGSRR